MDFSNFLQLAEHFNILFSWKFLISAMFISSSFLGLYFTDFFHDILKDMFKTIVISCVFFALLIVCKIGFQLEELVNWKHKVEKEYQIQNQREQKNLYNLLHLSKRETMILKYLFNRSTKSAWLPQNLSETLLLLKKGYINIVSQKRGYIDTFSLDKNKLFYVNETDTLYTINENILTLIEKHKKEITLQWKKIRIDKKLNNYQI